jgi:hypothetical protein
MNALLSGELCFDANSQLKDVNKLFLSFSLPCLQACPIITDKRIFMKFIFGKSHGNLSKIPVLVEIRE